jgi:hypothetical protein
MANLLKIIPRVGLAFVLLFLIACRATDSPATQTLTATAQPASTPAQPASTQTPTANQLPDWIVNPKTLPPGRVGKNNCKLPFGVDVPDWKFHQDAGCWERPGPDGWTRQQFQKLHVPKFRECNDRPGDATAIRVSG